MSHLGDNTNRSIEFGRNSSQAGWCECGICLSDIDSFGAEQCMGVSNINLLVFWSRAESSNHVTMVWSIRGLLLGDGIVFTMDQGKEYERGRLCTIGQY
ncbi:hypothetical protein TREMEDRAFT_55789 [Tremella mesenterica DSM 1558]|uniref:uncharacterized protein n=1 Tax=Tremella mesenterica (strain ATCC 24925 / CBS 8224 / DSM 1558 / NBRC 9311 / NRRL Y-6157 / RJB 2259-6 / UBC 559-6) TaxID=578456 RepID=UPI0003F4959D|nr:uncharacterized protein TREMEDRAFT_55789 [Tremella mesenterica DSM 1558]EIW71979.1 hypothetical protein TREMEDRAFT_55789 [Tremella mesenterica DSM 1558]